jgi:RNA polymerase sigma-70 factor (ECF subfamily)
MTPVEGRPLEDDELVELAIAGDVGSYERLMQRYQSLAFRVAFLITHSAADAEEAAQEAFVKAYYALRTFRRGAPFRPWLLTIVSNEARNRRRSDARRAALALRAAEDRPVGDAAPSSEETVLAEERREALVKALEELKEDDRVIIGYRYLLELSEDEVAAVLGCPKGTVKSRLSRAMARLRELVGEGFDLERSVVER